MNEVKEATEVSRDLSPDIIGLLLSLYYATVLHFFFSRYVTEHLVDSEYLRLFPGAPETDANVKAFSRMSVDLASAITLSLGSLIAIILVAVFATDEYLRIASILVAFLYASFALGFILLKMPDVAAGDYAKERDFLTIPKLNIGLFRIFIGRSSRLIRWFVIFSLLINGTLLLAKILIDGT